MRCAVRECIETYMHIIWRYYWIMQVSCHFRDCEALLVTSCARSAV